jgi:hypothetical protein
MEAPSADFESIVTNLPPFLNSSVPVSKRREKLFFGERIFGRLNFLDTKMENFYFGPESLYCWPTFPLIFLYESVLEIAHVRIVGAIHGSPLRARPLPRTFWKEHSVARK